MKKVSYIILALTLLLFPFKAYAHEGGISAEIKSGEYLIDVGREQEILTEDSPVVFDFLLTNTADNSDVDFDSVWVTIEHNNTASLATGIHRSKLGRTTLVYSPPKDGQYKMVMRFIKESKTIADGSFDFSVTKNSKDNSGIPIGLIAISVSLGAACGFLVSQWLKKS